MEQSFELGKLAQELGAKIIGDADCCVNGIAPLHEAGKNQISFLSSKLHEKYLTESDAGAVVLKAESANLFSGNKLVVDNPYLAYARLSAVFDPRSRRNAGIHPSAVVAESAVVPSSVSVGANCVIGENVVLGEHCEIYPGTVISEDCVLGDNCLIYANVTIYSNVRIGNNAIIHGGTVIGSDGFGFAPSQKGWTKIHQIGGVVIGNNVEIGANTAIDRGALGDTVIKDGVIIDNLVHLAHNVEVGENTALAGCVGVAGSTKIGKNCMMAGQVGINGHITIADGSQFNGGTVVTKTVKEPGVYSSGTPMMDVKSWRKAAVRFGQLDDMASRLKNIEKIIKTKG